MEDVKKDEVVDLKSGEADKGETKEVDPSATKEGGEGDKTVPYSRFKEVNDSLKELREKMESIESLQVKKDTGKSLTPDEQKELDAKSYLKGLLKETLQEETTAKTQAEEKELKEFNSSVSSVLEENTDVKREDFLKFIEEKADKYGVTSVTGAMILFRDMNNLTKESKEAGKKEEKNKPKFPANEGSVGGKSVNDSGKSLYQIAEEAINELQSK